MHRLKIRCESCHKFFFDDNYQNNYDGNITRSNGDYVLVLRACPYCDHVYSTLVQRPSHKKYNEWFSRK